MKKYNWLALLLMGASIVVLISYQFWDRSATDRIAPELHVEEGLLEASVYGDEKSLLQGVTAQDDRDGDVTDSIIVESVGGITGDGQAIVNYAAFDHSGNVSKIGRTIRYTDYESPKFRLMAPLMFQAGGAFEVVDLMGAQDILDGDITHRVRATALSDKILTEAGEYQVLFQVTNSLGDTQNLTLTADLYPVGTYNAELELTEYLVYLPQGTRFVPKDYLQSFRSAAGRTEMDGRLPDGFELELEGSVDIHTPGVYEVKYIVRNDLSYQTYSGSSRIVVIVEE